MKIYLVGGAVRDALLGYPHHERDWVVVGARPEDMIQQGFKQVGRDFPVFLHPQTREEYALARKERKNAPGYYGFDCDYNPSVRLEEDLLRRDLTINAIAQDEQGRLIDPYNGVADLKAKKLRHVSPAFAEDPVRVLRLARFVARYHHLGFSLCDETRSLVYAMVVNGELNHLVPERVWQELARSLTERDPDIFISSLRACGALAVIFPEIDRLFGVPATPKYHPEIDSGIHTLEVLQYAAKHSTDPMTRFAALVHDLGKAVTPAHKWPRHLAHEHRGLAIIESFCQRLHAPSDWRRFALMVCKHHLNIHRIAELRPQTIVKILEQTDAFRQGDKFAKLLQVCEADAGQAYAQLGQWQQALTACQRIQPQAVMADGFEGLAIKQELHARRVAQLQELSTHWKQEKP